jgi:hypothetical protein
MPEIPVALEVIEHDCYSFLAHWLPSENALGYYLDVALDPEFKDFLGGYDNYDAGNDTLQTVENLDPGMYYYRVRSYNDYGISDNSNTIEADICVGVDNERFQVPGSRLQVYCYPNPTGEIVDLRFSVYNLQSVIVKIYDVHGREVAVVLDKLLPAGEHTCKYDLSGLPGGIYLARILAGDQASSIKLVYNPE